MHLDDPGPLGSLDISAFWIDEAHEPEGEEVPESTFQMLMARLRHPIGPHKGFITTNPGGKDWVWNHFFNPKGPHAGDTDFWGQVMPTSSNKKYLPPGYEEELRKNNPPSWVTRFLDVSFDAFEGQIFPEFDENVHTINVDELDISPYWESAPGFDFGVTAPTAVVYGSYDKKQDMLYIYDEYYKADAEVGKVSTNLMEHGFNWSWADPSVHYRGHNKETPAMLYAKEGISLIGAANDELVFFKALQMRVKDKRIIIARDRCPNLIDQVKQAAWDPKVVTGESTREKAKTGLRYPNHALDALKYLMSGLGLWGEEIEATKPTRVEDEDRDEEEDKFNMRAVRPRKGRRV